eukprot:m51a1_g196 Conserved oligomeric Golgi complex subunit 2 (697) ;mRNA; r:633211-635658
MDGERALSFSKDVFTGDAFNVDTFIADCRARLPIESVLVDLHSHSSALHAALLDVINAHYSSFADLSSGLGSIEKLIAQLADPLSSLHRDLTEWYVKVDAAAKELAAREAALAESSKRRLVLETMKEALASLSKVESILSQLDESESSATERACDIERVCNLLSKLALYQDSALKDTPLINSVRDRLASVRAKARERLGAAFLDAYRSKEREPLAACLRAYCALQGPAAAVLLFRTEVIRPYVFKALSPDRLDSGGAVGSYSNLTPALDAVVQWVAKEVLFIVEESRAVGEFEFLAAVWLDVDEVLSSAAPSLFSQSMGIADVFQKNYIRIVRFTEALESLCNTPDEVVRMRSVYSAQMLKRWNTKIYFHLRSQDIVGALEVSFALPRNQQLSQPSAAGKPPQFATRSAKVLWESLQLSISDSVVVPATSSMFLRLCMQMISRFARWVSDGASWKQRVAETPGLQPPGEPWASMTAVADFVHPFYDLGLLLQLLSGQYRLALDTCMSSPYAGTPLADEISASVNEALDEAVTLLQRSRMLVEAVFVEGTTGLCTALLRPMYSIMNTIRTQRGSRGPVSPSHYVAQVFEPLRALMAFANSLSGLEDRRRWSTSVASAVFEKCTEISAELQLTAHRSDSIMTRLQAEGSTAARDTARFEEQLGSDMRELGAVAERLGVDVAASQPYQRLLRCVSHGVA